MSTTDIKADDHGSAAGERHRCMTDDFWDNRFHCCALAAGFIAAGEGRLHDSAYVRALAYGFYEAGAFQDDVKPPPNG